MASHCSRSLGQHAWELADAALLEPFSGSGHGEDSHAWVPAAAERPGADVVMEQFQEVALEFPLPDLQALEDMWSEQDQPAPLPETIARLQLRSCDFDGLVEHCEFSTDAPAAPPSPTETPGPVPRRKAARKVKNQISPELHMEHSPYLSMKGGGVFIMDQPGEGPDSDKSWNISEDGIFTGSQTVPRSDGAQDQGPQKPVCLSPLLIPVSVPVPDRSTDVQEKTWLQTASSSGGQEHLKSLIMPPLSEAGGALAGRRSWAAGGSLSQLILAYQPPPYTPPPMLSPLYLSAALDNVDRIAVDVVTISPKINVGPRFQAEIPPLRNPLMLLYDEHPAQLVWAPWRGLPSNAEMQKRVSDFLDLCSSSVLPGGGTNTELALHCLHEVQGNVLAALDLLMLRGDYRSSAHPLNDYHYTGSDYWSPQEKRLFRKGLLAHDKNFQLIHRVVPSKSVGQCVEYYYTMKKLKKFKRRGPKEQPSGETTEEHQIGQMLFLRKPRPPLQTNVNGTPGFLCGECGRGFEKVKSRSAHMKMHRHHEQSWPGPVAGMAEPPL